MSQPLHHGTILSVCFFTLACVVLAVSPSAGQAALDEPDATTQPVVISATRTEQPVEAATSSVTVITAKEIEERQWVTVADALRTVVGVDVAGQGAAGGVSSVFMRGADSEHTLVMIDGVQVNNPTTGSFDFADLTTDNIERIEIIRGAHSTLYGSDAVGGVINIITKKGKGAPTVAVTAEGGRYATGRGALSVAGATDRVDYSVSLSHERSEGFSHAPGGANEADGYLNSTLAARFGLVAAGDGRLEFIVRYILAQADLDGFGPVDEGPPWQRTERLVLASSLRKPITTWWNQRLQLSLNQSQYINKFLDFFSSTYMVGEFDARSQRVDWQHDLSVGDWVVVTLGSEYEGQAGENSGDLHRHTMTNYAFYGQSQFSRGGFTQVAGVRFDSNNRYGEIFTYELEVAYLIAPAQTRLRASLGTGFHGPTLQDLFFPNFGNPNLKPETSQTVEAGIEQSLFDRRLVISITHFRTVFENLIQFTDESALVPPPHCVAPYAPFNVCPVNIAAARSEGQEIVVTMTPVEQATLTASYTHITAKDRSVVGPDPLLLRRPRGKAYLGATVTPLPAWIITAAANYVGNRNDVGGQAGSYWVGRASSSYAVTKFLQIFGRVENLTGRRYQDSFGFNAPGRSFYGGVRATLP